MVEQLEAADGTLQGAPMAKLPVMNNTKWEELRLAMHQLGELRPLFRILDAENEQLSHWDGEWSYHFRLSSYSTIEWVELRVSSGAMRQAVLDVLQTIRVPGIETEEGFKVFGYAEPGQTLDYL